MNRRHLLALAGTAVLAGCNSNTDGDETPVERVSDDQADDPGSAPSNDTDDAEDTAPTDDSDGSSGDDEPGSQDGSKDKDGTDGSEPGDDPPTFPDDHPAAEHLERVQSTYARAIRRIGDQIDFEKGIGLETSHSGLGTSQIEWDLAAAGRAVDRALKTDLTDRQRAYLEDLDVAIEATETLVAAQKRLHESYDAIEDLRTRLASDDWAAIEADATDHRDVAWRLGSELRSVERTVADVAVPDAIEPDDLPEQAGLFADDAAAIEAATGAIERLAAGHRWLWNAHEKYRSGRYERLYGFFQTAEGRFERAGTLIDEGPTHLRDVEWITCHADPMADAAYAYARASAARDGGDADGADSFEETAERNLEEALACDRVPIDSLPR